MTQVSQARCVPSMLGTWKHPGSRKARAASGIMCQGRQHPGVFLAILVYFTGSLEAQVRQTRGTIQCQQQQQWSQSRFPSAGQEQMCFYGAATPRLHDAPGCTVTPVCSHVTESACCTVCSSSSIQDGLKICCVLL